MSHHPPVTIIIVNYETSAYVQRCTKSLQQQDYPHETIVVDNPSPANDLPNLPNTPPLVRVIAAPRNLGYGLGCNLGATHATPDSAYIAILNPDTAVPPNQLAAWIQSYTTHCPNGGILGPALHNENGTVQRSAYAYINGLNYWLTHSLLAGFLINRKKGSWTGGQGRGFTQANDPTSTDFPPPDGSARPTDWLMGAALLLDRQTWQRLGGFSDKYFLYSEDTDLCWRANQLGYPVIYDPTVHIWHSQGDPSGSARETGIIRLFDGLKRFADLNYHGLTKFGLYTSVLSDMFLRIAIFTPLTLLKPHNTLHKSRLRGYRAVLRTWLPFSSTPSTN